MELTVKSLSFRFGRSGLALFLLAGLSAIGCSASPGSTEDDSRTESAIVPINPLPRPVVPISPGPSGCQTPSAITDWGYPGFREYADVNGDTFLDYCRMVGDAPNIFLSCELGCRLSGYSATYSYASPPGIDEGIAGTGQMIDVNGDNRADYCRTVGGALNTAFSACDLAIAGGFGADTYEISYPVGFTPSAPVAVADGSDGTPIDVYKGPNALWFHGKDAAGMKHELTLGTSGNYTTVSIVENGASIVSLAMTADAAGYVTIYGKTPTLSKSYKFFSNAQNWTSSGFLTDFAPALQHFGYFQSVGANVQSNLTNAMATLGITTATPADVTVDRAANAGFWAAIAFIGVTAVAGVATGGGSLIIQTAIVLLAGAGGALGDAAITEGTESTPTINSNTPVPPAGNDSPPPSNACDPNLQSCDTPPTTGTGPDDGSGGAGGGCTTNSPQFQVRHARWAQLHPDDLCTDCCE